MGNALHYTQIKKSDLKFEPFAEFLAEDGDWMDLTIISDSPLLEHDAMFMQQHHDKARERLLEIMARDEQRVRVMARSAEADGPPWPSHRRRRRSWRLLSLQKRPRSQRSPPA